MRSVAIIPAYQAAGTIEGVLGGLRHAAEAAGVALEIIVVDDGSTDDTAARASRAGAVLVRLPRNAGKGAALRAGFRRALDLGYGVAVTLDADGQHPPEEVLRLALHPAPEHALVLAVRDLRAAGAPRPNVWSNAFSNRALSLFAGRPLRDTQCGLRRLPLQRCLSLGELGARYAYESELVLRAARLRWPIVEVDATVLYPPAPLRVSHFHSVRDPARIVARVLYVIATTSRA